jgi:hypothetical protein
MMYVKTTEYETTAPFHINGKWTWKTWRNSGGNTHAVIMAKSDELKADAWDFGQATHTRIDVRPHTPGNYFRSARV